MADAEEQFEFGIVLTAEAGEVFVGIGILAADRLNVTDRGSEWGLVAGWLTFTKKAPGAVNAYDVIERGECGDEKNDNGYCLEQDWTSFRNGYLFMRLLQLRPVFQF
jgi:hypothetical protein